MGIDWQQLLAGPVASLIVGGVSAVVGARWALHRFQQEKWWEHKVQAYTTIARSLFLMKRYADAWIERTEAGVSYTEEYRKQLESDWASAARDVEEATVLGSFVVSEDAAAILTALKKERDIGASKHDPYESAVREAKALDEAIPAFTNAARRDLGLKSARAGISSSLRS